MDFKHAQQKNSIMNPMSALPNFNNYQHFVNLLSSVSEIPTNISSSCFVCFKNQSMYYRPWLCNHGILESMSTQSLILPEYRKNKHLYHSPTGAISKKKRSLNSRLLTSKNSHCHLQKDLGGLQMNVDVSCFCFHLFVLM